MSTRKTSWTTCSKNPEACDGLRPETAAVRILPLAWLLFFCIIGMFVSYLKVKSRCEVDRYGRYVVPRYAAVVLLDYVSEDDEQDLCGQPALRSR